MLWILSINVECEYANYKDNFWFQLINFEAANKTQNIPIKIFYYIFDSNDFCSNFFCLFCLF